MCLAESTEICDLCGKYIYTHAHFSDRMRAQMNMFIHCQWVIVFVYSHLHTYILDTLSHLTLTLEQCRPSFHLYIDHAGVLLDYILDLERSCKFCISNYASGYANLCEQLWLVRPQTGRQDVTHVAELFQSWEMARSKHEREWNLKFIKRNSPLFYFNVTRLLMLYIWVNF